MHIGCYFFFRNPPNDVICWLLIYCIWKLKIFEYCSFWILWSDGEQIRQMMTLYHSICTVISAVKWTWIEWCLWRSMCLNSGAELCGLCLYAYASVAMCPSCGLHPWSSLSLVERVVPAMVVWLILRTLCSRGSEISLDHIVLCLCLARCQKRHENRL